MELASHAVSHQFPNDPVTMRFRMLLDSETDVAGPIAGGGLFDPQGKAFLRNTQ